MLLLLIAPCSLLPAPCSLFPAPCSLLPTPYSLLPVPCSLCYINNTMNNTQEKLTFKVALTPSAHRLAEKFQRQQSNPDQGKQVYLNTLAAYAMNFYCQCMGIDTDFSNSSSLTPVIPTLGDIADLYLNNLGKLECLPVLPQSQVIKIPPVVWEHRIGYMAVQLNQSLTEATLLGFVKTPKTQELPLSELGSLEDFLERIETLSQCVNLSQWFNQICDKGWQRVKTQKSPSAPQPAFRFRRPKVTAAKSITLETKVVSYPMDLVVTVTQESEQEIDIDIQVYARGSDHLPLGLKLMVIDESGEIFSEVSAGINDTIISNGFIGERQEDFTLKVALEEAIFTEYFVV
ncbi:MAG: DUF1822 family protein [Moorea sp. SIO3G5]|nr:DUF1822 family protein [Moorena sp. SIO3G5]